jgi:cell wall-associated NlpC family hydrolase
MRQTCAALIGAIALAGFAGGCASTGSVPRPFPSPGPRPADARPGAEATAATDRDTYALIGTALELRGVPYRSGGADPDGFDCSGFTQYVFGRHGVGLPRSVREQFDMGRTIRPNDLREGDLLFFAIDGSDATHVAIAVGGDSFVHAPSNSGVVRVERLGARYWAERFVGARRIW